MWARYPDDSHLCIILATTLLFAALDPQIGEEMVPQPLRDEKITTAYIPTHPNVQQPVQRIFLTIYRIQDTLMIDEIAVHGGDNGGAPVAGTTQAVVTEQQHAQVLINVQALQQAVAQNH
jgi:hypothetical protein